MRIPRAITSLIDAFERLPGIGPKTAARLTFYLLAVPENQIDKFADSLKSLKTQTVICQTCFNVAETDPCDICSDTNRNQSIICVVEQPLDVLALEKGGGFRGVYHVLGGVIDPLHNIGPEEIRVGELMTRLQYSISNTQYPIKEIILALDPDMEGEATCLYLSRQITNLKSQIPNLKLTRLAHGLPVGADIEYADEVTLSRAMTNRTDYN